MAVAIHVGKTNKMDYDFKDFDASSWRLYFAWRNVQSLHKFSIALKKLAPSDEVSLVDDIVQTSKKGDTVSPTSTVTAHSIYKQKRKREGCCKNTIAAEEKEKRKKQRQEEKDQKLEALVNSIEAMKDTMNRKNDILKKKE